MLQPVPLIDPVDTRDMRWVVCPMCGFEFDRTDTVCNHGCPLGNFCNLVSCPNCDYEFPDKPQRTSWLWRLLRRKEPDSLLPKDVVPASNLRSGERAEVVCLGSSKSPRFSALTVFGIEPGASITMIQQRPSCVIRIDETELALDPEIAERYFFLFHYKRYHELWHPFSSSETDLRGLVLRSSLQRMETT